MTYQIYIVQAIAILFAVALAKHDAPAIIQFEKLEKDNLLMARFHRYNFWAKTLFCVLAALIFLPKDIMTTKLPDFLNMFFSGLLSGLWIYLLFDPCLNKNRPGRDWDYIGSNDADGRRWIKWFGENAGEKKAVILSVLVIAVNILFIFL